MRAITVSQYGAVPALTEVPDPHPGRGQVLIKIKAAGINPMDRSTADGEWKARMPAIFPLILGFDLAGVVEAAGEGAVKFAVGEEVYGQLIVAPLGSAGTYAEYVAVTQDAPLARIPAYGGPTPTGSTCSSTWRATPRPSARSPLSSGPAARR
jgi:NADPH:quinone reductase-like Zn-dependent oxidoreductase